MMKPPQRTKAYNNISKKSRKKLKKIDKKEAYLLGSSNVVTTKSFKFRQKMGAASKVKIYTKEEIAVYEEYNSKKHLT